MLRNEVLFHMMPGNYLVLFAASVDMAARDRELPVIAEKPLYPR